MKEKAEVRILFLMFVILVDEVKVRPMVLLEYMFSKLD